MAQTVIHVEEASLNDLKNALATAGESYKSNLSRLNNLINEITSGDIQGDPANDLLQKYQSKEATLTKLAETIDEAAGYVGLQTTKFSDMIGELKSGMK